MFKTHTCIHQRDYAGQESLSILEKRRPTKRADSFPRTSGTHAIPTRTQPALTPLLLAVTLPGAREGELSVAPRKLLHFVETSLDQALGFSSEGPATLAPPMSKRDVTAACGYVARCARVVRYWRA